jgi:hypothetical protein
LQVYVAEDLAGLSRLVRQHSAAAAAGCVAAELDAAEGLPLPLLHPAPASLRQRGVQQQQQRLGGGGEPAVLHRQALALQHLALQVGCPPSGCRHAWRHLAPLALQLCPWCCRAAAAARGPLMAPCRVCWLRHGTEAEGPRALLQCSCRLLYCLWSN